MPAPTFRSVLAATPWVLLVLGCSPAQARARTDVVTLLNGDRITGEVKRLERGRLELKTDDVGTIYVEWDNLASLDAARTFEIGTSDGRRFLGTLATGGTRSLALATPTGTLTLPMDEVTFITPIGESFWTRLDGSVDFGFSYTKSSDIAQLNFNAETLLRRPQSETRLGASATLTKQKQAGTRDDRGSVDGSYVRFLGRPWFASAGVRVETNESLGIRLRSQAGAAFGPRLINTNRAQMLLGGGLVFNDERAIDAPATQNVEALLLFRSSYYTYDRPKTNLDVTVQYYPSLSNRGRQRLQLDAAVKRELWKDFFLSLNGFDSYDSRPPNPVFDTNDVGVVLSIGWSY